MNIFEHIDKRVVVGFGVLLLILLGLLFYWILRPDTTNTGPISIASVSPLDATLGKELLAALSKLKSTKLDTSIFKDPIFQSLKDYGVDIASQPVGRRNPFAGFDGTAGGTTGAKVPTTQKAGIAPIGAPKTAPKSPASGTGGGFDAN